MSDEVVFIAGISSDIGAALARLYRQRDARVIGTYRDDAHVEMLRSLDGVTLIPCDVCEIGEIAAATQTFAALGTRWTSYISAIGQLAPIGPFLDIDWIQWERSLAINGAAQLALVRALAPFRGRGVSAKLAFLVGGGINGTFTNYSAYCLGKITLVKFCELIDDECPDIHAVALGTGWVATKIHRQTLASGERAGDNLRRTREFIDSGAQGTTCEEILACLDWCFAQDRAVTGGRNVSVVHDPWRDGGADLIERLRGERGRYKLRREGS